MNENQKHLKMLEEIDEKIINAVLPLAMKMKVEKNLPDSAKLIAVRLIKHTGLRLALGDKYDKKVLERK